MINKSTLRQWIAYSCVGTTFLTGCGTTNRFQAWRDSKDVSYYQNFVTQIEYPDVQAPVQQQVIDSPMPLSIENPSDLPTMELKLQEAVRMALERSDVLRNLGGNVVTAPAGTPTQIDPALSDLNPLGGTQAALAAFDAAVTSQLFWQKTDRPLNVRPTPGFFTGISRGTGATQTNQIRKFTATGASFALRSSVIYDRNNNPTRPLASDFNGFIEAEYRQPLLQGSGTTFNRIAGPNAVVGQYNGILIGRINTDVSLADFEAGVIRLINDVETQYWELYFAYRALDAQITGRESALRTWQRIKELQKVGAKGGEADAEAQSRSNYYLFASQVNDALAGTAGLYSTEQKLRYMLGFPATDGRLIKPVDDPLQAQVIFDWQSSVSDAVTRRVEIRRQEWVVKRRELECIASRLNRRARLDWLNLYRYRGLGNHLIGQGGDPSDYDNLFSSLGTGDFQEWQTGAEWSYNVGLRQASAAVRHAQLNLAKEVAILQEQQLRVSHDLSNASRQMTRSYEQMQINYNRIEADKLQVEVLRNRYERGLININFLLQAQQQLATSTSAFYRSLVDYNLAIRDFHREKGSLLSYNQVNLAEEALNGSILAGAYERGRFFTPRDNPEEVTVKNQVSQGAFDPTSVGVPAIPAQFGSAAMVSPSTESAAPPPVPQP